MQSYLADNNVLGIEGIDTRALVRRIRVRGAMTGVLSTTDLDDASLVNKARTSPSIVGRDLAKSVMPDKSFAWKDGWNSPLRHSESASAAARYTASWPSTSA